MLPTIAGSAESSVANTVSKTERPRASIFGVLDACLDRAILVQILRRRNVAEGS